MSLAIAIEAADGIVLAADSRATFGDPRGMTAANDTVQKIYKLSPRTALAMVGQAEIGASLIQYIIAALAAQPGANVNTAAEAIRTTGNQYFGQWFGPPQFMMGPMGPVAIPRPDVWLLLVGHDAGGQAKILSLGSTPPFNFAPNLSTMGFAALGVIPLAVYLLNRLYRRGIDLETAKDLAAYCILETATQDAKVGGPIRLAVARSDQDTIILAESDVAQILPRVDRHRETLRSSFSNPAPESSAAVAPQPAVARGPAGDTHQSQASR
jgi:20S proteasome alpha/beta subunit